MINVPGKTGRYNSPPLRTDFVLEVNANMKTGVDKKNRAELLQYTDTKPARNYDFQVHNDFPLRVDMKHRLGVSP